jgi:hypothetical protein
LITSEGKENIILQSADKDNSWLLQHKGTTTHQSYYSILLFS